MRGRTSCSTSNRCASWPSRETLRGLWPGNTRSAQRLEQAVLHLRACAVCGPVCCGSAHRYTVWPALAHVHARCWCWCWCWLLVVRAGGPDQDQRRRPGVAAGHAALHRPHQPLRGERWPLLTSALGDQLTSAHRALSFCFGGRGRRRQPRPRPRRHGMHRLLRRTAPLRCGWQRRAPRRTRRPCAPRRRRASDTCACRTSPHVAAGGRAVPSGGGRAGDGGRPGRRLLLPQHHHQAGALGLCARLQGESPTGFSPPTHAARPA